MNTHNLIPSATSPRNSRAASSSSTAATTTSVSAEELRKYFHLPIQEVAVKLGICVTVLKQHCRRLGIPRWPFRKIQSLDKMITALEAVQKKAGVNCSASLVEELSMLRKTRADLVSTPTLVLQDTLHSQKAHTHHSPRPSSPAPQELQDSAVVSSSLLTASLPLLFRQSLSNNVPTSVPATPLMVNTTATTGPLRRTGGMSVHELLSPELTSASLDDFIGTSTTQQPVMMMNISNLLCL